MNATWIRIVTTSALLVAASAFAQPAQPAEATVSKQQATKTALDAVPGGRIKSAELEHEGGRHVWSFDITRPGIPGATEIQVDAKSGLIVSRKDESAAEEAKEAQAEKAEKSRAGR